MKSKELLRLEKFINEGKHDDALQLMKHFEEKEEHTLYEIVSCHLLKCNILFQQGKYADVIKLAEQTYKESLRLGKNFLSIDALMLMPYPLLQLSRFDKAYDIIKQGEEILNSLTQELQTEYTQREADIAYNKAYIYQFRNEVDLAEEYSARGLTLREEFGSKQQISQSLRQMAWVLGIGKMKLDRALKYAQRGLVLAEESKNKYQIAWSLNTTGVIYSFKGELDQCIILFERSTAIFRELNDKYSEAWVFNCLGESYRMKGELDRAIECLEQSLSLSHETGNLFQIANIHDYLIQILIEKGDLKRAQISLHDLEQLNNQLKDKLINSLYLLNKALVLKTSLRARDRGKAEEILKQLLKDEDLEYEIRLKALLNLCDLLLTELRMTNDLEVLDELTQFIGQLLEIAEKSHSYWVMGETYLLQAKLALISLNLKEARQLLTQGQQIAEKYGLDLLARKISYEHDNLLEHINLWEKLKEIKAPLTERIEMSRLNEQIESMTSKRALESLQMETEQPILLSIITEGGKMLLSNPFTADMIFDIDRMGVFLSSFNTFSHQIFHESYDRVKFGKYKVLMNSINQFYICYMFHGHSYSAQQKISHFTEIIKKDKDIIESLENADKKNSIINVNDNSILEEIIIESFMSDPQLFRVPFKAYLGDEPFVFVSYAHTNKLDVYPIIDYINKMGINIWYDEGIPISENWKKSIADNLGRCSTFLVFISPQILNSEMVKKEISFALKKKKKFVAVYLKETELPIELEFEIADIQALMKYRMNESEFYTLLREVLKIMPIK